MLLKSTATRLRPGLAAVVIAAAGLVAATSRAGIPDEARFVEIGHRVDPIQLPAGGGFAIADVDGDGKEDAVFVGRADVPVLFVLGATSNGDYQIKSSQRVVNDGSYIGVSAASVQGEQRIVTASRNGRARLYGGWPLTERANLSIAADGIYAQVGDVDGDGRDDLLVLRHQELLRYDLQSGALTGSAAVPTCWTFALAQLDADSALEIVLACDEQGKVVDGATFATDWDYLDSFGIHLAAGRFATNTEMRWFGGSASSYTLFRAEPWSPLWTGTLTTGLILSMTRADIEGAGRDVLILASTGAIQVLDPRTEQSISHIVTNQGSAWSVTGGDVDGDGRDEIIFSSEYGDWSLSIADATSGALAWRHLRPQGAFRATALGDVDGDGKIDLVAASGGGFYSTLSIFDAWSGTEHWRSGPPDAFEDPFFIAAHDVALVPHPQSAGMDIVFAGEANGFGRLTVVDGVSMQPRLSIGLELDPAAPLASRRIASLAMLDYDGDGTPDYVLATEPISSLVSGARLFVFSGIDGALLWRSPVLGQSQVKVYDLFTIAQDDGDTEIVISMQDGLRAFSAASGLLKWSLGIYSAGASWVPDGIDGPEIVSFTPEGLVSVFDYRTRALLREFSLPSPLRAMTALGGQTRRLIAASDGRLVLVDGSNGAARTATPRFDSMGEGMKPLSTLSLSDSSEFITAGGDFTLARFRIDLTEQLFRNGFEAD